MIEQSLTGTLQNEEEEHESEESSGKQEQESEESSGEQEQES